MQRLPPSQLSTDASPTSGTENHSRAQRHSDSSTMPQNLSAFFGPNIGNDSNANENFRVSSTATNIGSMPNFVQQLIGGLGELGQNATFNTNITAGSGPSTNHGNNISGVTRNVNGTRNNMEVHLDLGNVSQIVNAGEIRSRVRNIRRFLSMAQSRLNRLEVTIIILF